MHKAWVRSAYFREVKQQEANGNIFREVGMDPHGAQHRYRSRARLGVPPKRPSRRKLAAEGLFDPARKKPIPSLPQRIGIVTSPQAAALRDILNVLRRRHDTAGILIFPAQVQGEAAALEVMRSKVAILAQGARKREKEREQEKSPNTEAETEEVASV